MCLSEHKSVRIVVGGKLQTKPWKTRTIMYRIGNLGTSINKHGSRWAASTVCVFVCTVAFYVRRIPEENTAHVPHTVHGGWYPNVGMGNGKWERKWSNYNEKSIQLFSSKLRAGNEWVLSRVVRAKQMNDSLRDSRIKKYWLVSATSGMNNYTNSAKWPLDSSHKDWWSVSEE